MKQSFLVLILIWGLSVPLFSQVNDKVFYSSFRPEGWDIHLSTDNGKTFSPFTTHESLDYDAKISTDGKWVVFTSERGGQPHLYIKNTIGDTLPRLLVNSTSMQDQVDFSPDGKWIIFLSTHEGNSDIYKLPFKPNDTLDISQAINLTNNIAGDFRPSYSNDGKTIAFSSDRDHPIKPHSFFVFAMQRTGDLFSMSADGGEVMRLTDSEGWDGSPFWSEDDNEVYFYSTRNNATSLYKMSRDGKNQEAISPSGNTCFSPIMISENMLLFTNRNKENNKYSILGLNTETKIIDSTLVQEMDMFNVDYHQSGAIVYHGGKKPQENVNNLGGFNGDLLVKNYPDAHELANRSVNLYGVRRAFAAPPTIENNQIVYDYLPGNGPADVLTPFAYLLTLLPIFAIFWLIVGIVLSINKRKVFPFWNYLIFSVVSVVVAAGIGFLFFNKFIVQNLPISNIRWLALIIFIILVLLAILTFSFHKKRKAINIEGARLFKYYFWMFSTNALVAIYIALFCGSFMDISPNFYAVDYTTNQVTHLFQFEAGRNFNPMFSRIVDTKFTPDGEYLQFTVSGFRTDPKNQGCVYRYHLNDKTLERLTELDSNNGFADFSKDNSTMVFRSGRTGNMDIYVKENGDIKNLTNSPAKENFPIISHDGNMIAYNSDVSGTDIEGIVKTMDIYITTRLADNSWSEPKQITSYKGQEGHAHFSPDGEWLIYTTEEFGISDEQPLVQPYIFSPQMYGEIVAIRIRDGEKIRLTHNKWEDGAPLWVTEK